MGRQKNNKIVFNTFMCLNCGNAAYTLPRATSFQHKTGHRKKLYCPHCKQTVNCIECKDEAEVFKFKNDFENGVYINEREDSLDYVRGSCEW